MSRLSSGSPARAAPGAQPSPRRPAAAQTYLRVDGRGLAASGASPAAASAPLSAGPGGAGTALPRPRADCAQPDAAGLCPRRRHRGRRALADMLSFRTCPRGSYQEPAAAGEAAPSCRAAAASWRRPRRRPQEEGGEALLKIAPAEGSHPLPAHPLAARPRHELSGSGSWRPTVSPEQTPAGVARTQSQPQAAGMAPPPPQPRAAQQPETLRENAL